MHPIHFLLDLMLPLKLHPKCHMQKLALSALVPLGELRRSELAWQLVCWRNTIGAQPHCKGSKPNKPCSSCLVLYCSISRSFVKGARCRLGVWFQSRTEKGLASRMSADVSDPDPTKQFRFQLNRQIEPHALWQLDAGWLWERRAPFLPQN